MHLLVKKILFGATKQIRIVVLCYATKSTHKNEIIKHSQSVENIGADHNARMHSLVYTLLGSYMLETGLV